MQQRKCPWGCAVHACASALGAQVCRDVRAGHMCAHVHVPVGCSHTALAYVGMQVSQWHEWSQLCPQISLSGQRAGWRKGPLKLILYPWKVLGVPVFSECGPPGSCF